MSVEKLKAALAKHEPGKSQVVAVAAGAVVAACEAVPADKRDKIVAAVLKGSAAERLDRAVYPLADDLFHVVGLAEGGNAEPV